MQHMDRVAEAPAHKEANKDPSDFVATNKSMRCCFVCRLVKSERQFIEAGCENCAFLQMDEDRVRVQDYTTPNFSGLITVMDPTTSWATKWLHLSKYVPGAYALVVNDDPPDQLRDLLEDRGLKIAHFDN
eukprot:CAMPEP_0119116270 /NCGR_PEP_ID=MMETSP1180-20130426/52187_1 /TAXON_ID=3052 ORGANISM="Chlamydomonas cf sp, Strain CCMP681" /NCGR_SAMPLE_ID=MMETSP1180 /ASSEMBLY_ACC=CAM_ASM_000741 /LENGTH=129 /DNA_ID=CAMNT_0007105399 /DNA_START=220 /DNA_END=609 /DNA_ORIENTATION=-